jgi:metallo-beta-lactamase class B
MTTTKLRRAAAIALATAAFATAASAQKLEGCPSSELLNTRFNEVSRTGRMPVDLGSWLADPKAQAVEPFQAFDNVWFVGLCWVSAWVIKTPEGAILIDTLHDPFTDVLLDNLRKVGVNPADIKYVVMTHGHFDHAGGAYRLKPLTQAQFMMTEAGWDEAAQSVAASRGSPRAWTMIAKDRVLKDGDAIRLGGQTVRVYATPGHTWGTASYTFDVQDGARRYRAATVGGLGLNAIQNAKQVEAYIASIDRLAALLTSTEDPVALHLTTHPFSTGLLEGAAKLKARKAGEANPLVDAATFRAQLAALRAGAVERLEAERKAGR